MEVKYECEQLGIPKDKIEEIITDAQNRSIHLAISSSKAACMALEEIKDRILNGMKIDDALNYPLWNNDGYLMTFSILQERSWR